ncbi:hypothetical protein PoB_001625800 [Plakobranchus ocellatus]|uniref:Uncharacterized protein n=1 Tax=Plakobranchus ocellatus TaxID=259542 RepID=A0AAV3Z5L4_9GAST|nr:hypothetical protein PoB_001625800 [Plakobranchus ocellatus]
MYHHHLSLLDCAAVKIVRRGILNLGFKSWLCSATMFRSWLEKNSLSLIELSLYFTWLVPVTSGRLVGYRTRGQTFEFQSGSTQLFVGSPVTALNG